jgi:hypothetical protein
MAMSPPYNLWWLTFIDRNFFGTGGGIGSASRFATRAAVLYTLNIASELPTIFAKETPAGFAIGYIVCS